MGLGLGGYCALLALRRGPAPRAAEAAATAPPPSLPAPARLGHDPDFARVPLAAAEPRLQPSPVEIVVCVRNLPAAWRTPTAGVAVLPTSSPAVLTWLPLAAASPRGSDLVWRHPLPRPGEFVFTLAADRSFALHGYLARLAASLQQPTEVVLDATAAEVEFVLPAMASRAGPFRLLRPDDARWMPMDTASTGLQVEAGRPTRLWLGAGSYELRDPIAAEPSQRFTVPTTTRVEIRAELARTPGDRP